MTSEDLAWAAGFVDGEGCIFINRGQVRLEASNTDRRAIDRLRGYFGGNMRLVPTTRPRHRPVWSWTIVGPGAATALRSMLPYFSVKAEQASLALEFRETTGPRGRHLNDDVRERRRGLEERITALKHI